MLSLVPPPPNFYTWLTPWKREQSSNRYGSRVGGGSDGGLREVAAADEDAAVGERGRGRASVLIAGKPHTFTDRARLEHRRFGLKLLINK